MQTYTESSFNRGILSRWPDNIMPLKVYIGKFGWYKSKGNQTDEYKYTSMIIQGFNLWEELTNGVVSFERTMNLYDSQINIDWKRVERKSLGSCTFSYDKLGRYYSAELSIGLSDGIIHHQYMDENEVFHTILHEIGHSIGLGHSPNKGDIMYVPHEYGVTNITNNDIETVKWLYKLPVGKSREEILSKYASMGVSSIDEAILKLKDEKSDFEKTKDEIINKSLETKDLLEETANIGDLKKYLLQAHRKVNINFKPKR